MKSQRTQFLLSIIQIYFYESIGTRKKIMAKTIEQLQNYLEHYQAIYPKANRMGQAIIRTHVNKLKRQINRLKLNNGKPSAVQVIVNKEFAHHA